MGDANKRNVVTVIGSRTIDYSCMPTERLASDPNPRPLGNHLVNGLGPGNDNLYLGDIRNIHIGDDDLSLADSGAVSIAPRFARCDPEPLAWVATGQSPRTRRHRLPRFAPFALSARSRIRATSNCGASRPESPCSQRFRTQSSFARHVILVGSIRNGSIPVGRPTPFRNATMMPRGHDMMSAVTRTLLSLPAVAPENGCRILDLPFARLAPTATADCGERVAGPPLLRDAPFSRHGR